MSDFSLTLVLQIKTSKIINDMAKVQQKSEKISAFGGIFFVLDRFDRCYGYEGNKNSIYSCLKRLQDDGKAQRIRAGQDKGKYRKLE